MKAKSSKLFRIILNSSLFSFSKILFSSFLFFFIITLNPDDVQFIKTIINFWNWLVNFISGSFGETNHGKQIVFFQDQITRWTEPIGSIYFKTLFRTVLALGGTFLISSLFCIFEVVLNKKYLNIIRLLFEWISSIHMIILSLFVYKYFQSINIQIPSTIGIIMIILSSNVFYDFYTNQKSIMIDLFSKDFVIAAKAWGDNVWKHARRSIIINSIDQLFSIWIIIFTNTLIFEILTQKEGLGYLCWEYFISTDEGVFNSNFEIQQFHGNLFLAICMFIIITISVISLLRVLLINYLLYIRR